MSQDFVGTMLLAVADLLALLMNLASVTFIRWFPRLFLSLTLPCTRWARGIAGWGFEEDYWQCRCGQWHWAISLFL